MIYLKTITCCTLLSNTQKMETSFIISTSINDSMRSNPSSSSTKPLKPSNTCTIRSLSTEISRYIHFIKFLFWYKNLARKPASEQVLWRQAMRFWVVNRPGETWNNEDVLWYLWVYGSGVVAEGILWLHSRHLGFRNPPIRAHARLLPIPSQKDQGHLQQHQAVETPLPQTQLRRGEGPHPRDPQDQTWREDVHRRYPRASLGSEVREAAGDGEEIHADHADRGQINWEWCWQRCLVVTQQRECGADRKEADQICLVSKV